MDARSSDRRLPLILASASPRRTDLLQAAGIEFEQVPANIDEAMLPGERARPYVLRLAEAKARAGWRPGTRSLGADTVVAVDGQVLGKPRDDLDARRMLRLLSGRSHQVLTGVAVFDGQACEVACEATNVRFGALAEREIKEYVASGEPQDKAGAYAIQGGAARFVESIAGSYSNVVGLPVELVARMLR